MLLKGKRVFMVWDMGASALLSRRPNNAVTSRIAAQSSSRFRFTQLCGSLPAGLKRFSLGAKEGLKRRSTDVGISEYVLS